MYFNTFRSSSVANTVDQFAKAHHKHNHRTQTHLTYHKVTQQMPTKQRKPQIYPIYHLQLNNICLIKINQLIHGSIN